MLTLPSGTAAEPPPVGEAPVGEAPVGEAPVGEAPVAPVAALESEGPDSAPAVAASGAEEPG